MSKDQSISKQKLQKLYGCGKSMMEISIILGCSAHKVVYWMSQHGIKRRTRSKATYLKQNPRGDPFKIKDNLSPNEKLLYGLGVGIYWGEGNKSSRHTLAVANTDANLLKVFIRFLLEVCQLKTNKLRYSIVCFNDANPKQSKMYWSKALKISPEKFGKIVQIPPQGKGTYKRKSKFGVCTVAASNIKLKAWMMKQINNASNAWIV